MGRQQLSELLGASALTGHKASARQCCTEFGSFTMLNAVFAHPVLCHWTVSTRPAGVAGHAILVHFFIALSVTERQ